MKSALKIEHWALKRLKPYAKNPRVNDHAVDQMARQIEAFGFRVPILARSNGLVIDGHLRLKAAKHLKLKTVPIILADDMTPQQVRAFRIAVNRSAEWAEWDVDLLKMELTSLDAAGFDVSLSGFDLSDFGSPSGVDPDATPEPPKVATTRRGDVWLCGKHRIMCGDATNAEDVARLLARAKPNLMVTDPPYGVSYNPRWRLEAGVNKPWQKRAEGKVKNDDQSDWSLAWGLFTGATVYVWHGALHAAEVAISLKSHGFTLRSQIIWSKPSLVIGRGHYHWQHEPCWYAARGTAGWSGDRKQSTLWSVPNMHRTQGNIDDGKTEHGTQKPVECMARPMRNNSKKGEAVYDPFIGSGTSMIAAEMEGRVCLGLDIDPVYVDVAVMRWQSFTSKAATLEGDGRTFEEIAIERSRKRRPRTAQSPRRRPKSAGPERAAAGQ